MRLARALRTKSWSARFTVPEYVLPPASRVASFKSSSSSTRFVRFMCIVLQCFKPVSMEVETVPAGIQDTPKPGKPRVFEQRSSRQVSRFGLAVPIEVLLVRISMMESPGLHPTTSRQAGYFRMASPLLDAGGRILVKGSDDRNMVADLGLD
jgi:hypothetical protein